jgi:hypothetical protein
MGQENPRAQQTHNRRNRLDHCKLPNAPPAQARENDCSAAQSKRFKCREGRSMATDDLVQQTVRKRDRMPVNQRGRRSTNHSPLNCSPHFRRDRVAISSPSDAEVGTHRGVRASRPRDGRPAEMVIGEDGDSTARSDRPGGAQRCCRGNLSYACQLRVLQQVRRPRGS